MKKYLFISLSFFSVQFFSQTLDKNELEDFIVAKVSLDLKECGKSITSFNELITKYTNSEKIDDYYYFLDRAMLCKKSKELKVNFDSLNAEKDSQDPGTVSIGFFYADSLITQIDSQRISVAEDYLSKSPNGKHQLHFEDLLLWSYPKRNNQRFINLLERLISYKNYDLKYYAHLFLATYLYSEKN